MLGRSVVLVFFDITALLPHHRIKCSVKTSNGKSSISSQLNVEGNFFLCFSIMPLIGLRNEMNSGELKIIPLNRLPIVTEW
jgi:hypothetical protein